MIDAAFGVPLASGLVGSVAAVYALIYVWEFAKRLIR